MACCRIQEIVCIESLSRKCDVSERQIQSKNENEEQEVEPRWRICGRYD